jgi:hypothetical protein
LMYYSTKRPPAVLAQRTFSDQFDPEMI